MINSKTLAIFHGKQYSMLRFLQYENRLYSVFVWVFFTSCILLIKRLKLYRSTEVINRCVLSVPVHANAAVSSLAYSYCGL